jgi:hypothetical protein
MVTGSLERYSSLKNEGDEAFDSDSTFTLLQDDSVGRKGGLTDSISRYRQWREGWFRAIFHSIVLLAVALSSFSLGWLLQVQPSSAVSSSWSMLCSLFRLLEDFN